MRFNAELVATVEQLQKVNQQLREELDLYRRKLFGQSSERHVEDDSQLHLFDVGGPEAEGEEDEPDPPKLRARRRRKKKSEKLPTPWMPHCRMNLAGRDRTIEWMPPTIHARQRRTTDR